LLGQQVRYDGDHKRVDVLADELATRFEWIAVCPEVGAGMGVPRPPVQLVGDPEAPRMVTRDGDRDWTDEMLAFAAAELDRLDALRICGFVFKSRSPSCGLHDTPHPGEGLFARALRRRFPDIALADETELVDGARRESFVDAVLQCAQRLGIR
jgi:uncharacterized protein YbbK (DUF523 family)